MMVENGASKPLVSVVIPAYNSEAFIARAIRSALDQDYPNKEILVVDDGSSDNTALVVKKFGDPVRYFYQENAGPDQARNRGIEESRAEFIAFLDSDDEWLPGRLTKGLAPMLGDPSVGLTFCLSLARFPDGSQKSYGEELEQARVFPGLFWPPCTHSTPATTCRRSALLEVGAFNRRLPAFEDHDLWIRTGEITRIERIEEPLVLVHVRNESLSTQTKKNVIFASYFQIVRDALERRPDLWQEKRRTILAESWRMWGVWYCIDGLRWRGLMAFLKSLCYRPHLQTVRQMVKRTLPEGVLHAIVRIKHTIKKPPEA